VSILQVLVKEQELMARADLRMQLSSTDYGNFLANEPSPISTSTIADKATQVLVDQFNYLRSNATEPLSTFLEYMT
jgi:V-type H+-transporting ATPase subunit d